MVNWLVITLKIPNNTKGIENSVFVISINSKRIGVLTINVLKMSVANNPWEKVAIKAVFNSLVSVVSI